MKWNQIFNRGKRAEQAAAGSLHSLLLPSLLGISVCLLTLCSLTWAWFTAQVHTDTTTIQSANVAVTVATNAADLQTAGAATQADEDDTSASKSPKVLTVYAPNTTPEEGGYAAYNVSDLTDKKLYFTATGNAKMAYLRIQCDGKTYYTNYLPPAEQPTDTNTSDDTNDSTNTQAAESAIKVYSVTLPDEVTSPIKIALFWGPRPADITEGHILSWVGPVETMLPPEDTIPVVIGDPVDNTPTTNVPETPDQPTTGDQTPTTDGNQDTPQTPDTNPTQGGGTGGSSDGNTTEGTIGDSTNTETGSDGAQQTSYTPAPPAA